MTDFPNVRSALAATLTARGYTDLTPVQEAVIAPNLDAADLLVSAQTGSGKTVAFGLALAPTLLGEENHFARTRSPLAVVIAPTRELAMQVKRELDGAVGLDGHSDLVAEGIGCLAGYCDLGAVAYFGCNGVGAVEPGEQSAVGCRLPEVADEGGPGLGDVVLAAAV